MLKAVQSAALVALPVGLFFDTWGYVARVDGFSMQPTLNPRWKSHDYVFFNRWRVRQYEFQRGEIVSLVCPTNPNQRLVKRIVALEGDTVKTLGYRKHYVTIPRGHCWVEGDNHSSSMDSNSFGPVALGLVDAKATRIVWPPERWRQLVPADIENRVSWKNGKTITTQFS